MKAEELTWQDMKLIVNIADDLVGEFRESHGIIVSEEDYYKAVLLAYRKTKKQSTQ